MSFPKTEYMHNCRLEALETDSGFRTEEGSPKEDSPSPNVFRSTFPSSFFLYFLPFIYISLPSSTFPSFQTEVSPEEDSPSPNVSPTSIFVHRVHGETFLLDFTFRSLLLLLLLLLLKVDLVTGCSGRHRENDKKGERESCRRSRKA